MKHRLWLVIAALVSALFVAGCGDDGDSKKSDKASGEKSSITAPARVKDAGEISFCSDIAYPPVEFYDGSTPKGSDIDIAKEIADRMGVEAKFENTGFDAIIPALQSKKCDAIISSMNSTDERKKIVDFVDYMTFGQSIMTKPDASDEVKSLEDLAGKRVAVQVGTTLLDVLNEANKSIEGDKIEIKTFPEGQTAAAALKAGKVDAFFADSPVVADYVAKDADSFAFAGEPIEPLPVGIALRKDDTELRDAIQKAIDEMYEDDAMADILDKWKMQDFELEEG